MKVLVIAAHPDDEVLGMGGTIKKHTKNGDDVKIVIMATGISSRRSINYKNSTKYDVDKTTMKKMQTQIKELRRDAAKAARILGVTKLEFEEFPDNEMDTVSNLAITKKIEEKINTFKPKIVYTHSQFDINVDHRALYFATLTATRPKKNQIVSEVRAFEVPSSTEWYFPAMFSPNIFIDISQELPAKLKALTMYKNEIEKFPHPRSTTAIEAISKKWGSMAGFNSAEAFYLVRKLQD
jgi:LmbE family N-acetylglucosaminyl deacetylase